VGSCHIGESSADIRQELPILKGARGIWTAGRSQEVAVPKPKEKPAVAVPTPHTPALRPGPGQGVVVGGDGTHDLGAGPHEQERPQGSPASCSSSSLKDDCTETRCCSESGMQCYQKNPWWGTCRASCQVDSINLLEEKKYQTAWDCVPLGPRSPASIPTVPAAFKPPHERESASGDKKDEEVVIHMKAGEVPGEWIKGSTVTVLGGDGKPVHAQIVSMTMPKTAEQSGNADAMSPQQAQQGPQEHSSHSGLSLVLWIIAVLLGIPLLVFLGLFGFWMAYIRSKNGPSFYMWLTRHMDDAGEVVSTVSRDSFSRVSLTMQEGVAALHRATEPGKWQGQPVSSTPSQGPDSNEPLTGGK